MTAAFGFSYSLPPGVAVVAHSYACGPENNGPDYLGAMSRYYIIISVFTELSLGTYSVFFFLFFLYVPTTMTPAHMCTYHSRAARARPQLKTNSVFAVDLE